MKQYVQQTECRLRVRQRSRLQQECGKYFVEPRVLPRHFERRVT
jgi:hypothetical protein